MFLDNCSCVFRRQEDTCFQGCCILNSKLSLLDLSYVTLHVSYLFSTSSNLIHEMGKKKQNDSQQSSKTDTVSTSSNIFSKLFNKSQNRLPQWPPPLYFLMTTPFEENLLHFLTQRIALRTLMMVTTLWTLILARKRSRRGIRTKPQPQPSIPLFP